MTTRTRLTAGATILVCGITAAAHAQRNSVGLPPVPIVHGQLKITVAYPASGSAIDFGDSAFIFGTAGDGSARLSVAGQSVAVAPNGAWLAWVSLPHDSSLAISLVARRGRDSATSVLHLTRARWVHEVGAWIDRNSFSPVGDIWISGAEALPFRVRAVAGASVRLLLPDGRSLVFAPDSAPEPVSEAINAFGHGNPRPNSSATGGRYVATLTNHADSGRPVSRRGDPSPPGATLEVVTGRDTARVLWPVRINSMSGPPLAVTVNADPAHLLRSDPTTTGRSLPGGTYDWFFPPGTSTRMDLRIADQVRLRLAADAIAWVPQADVRQTSSDDGAQLAVMGSLTLMPTGDRTRLRIPLTRAVPSRVDEAERGLVISLFGAVSNANWTRYGTASRFVQLLTWKQEAADRIEISVTFDRMLWGWRSWVDGSDLIFEFRQAPIINAVRPLAGRRIVVDAGHPPGGACGPTGLCEPEANLNVANLVRAQLTAAGAVVTMTRTGPADVNLWPRVARADSLDADLLVSIHNNALPDGLNPFANNGTSTFFNHPHAIALARAVQSRLVANLGLRDLGVARGDLALTRPTWYPAILTEGLFMMVPEQEAALRAEEGQRRYATGVVEGITSFLREISQAQRARP